MDDVKWIKITTSIFDDDKIRYIEAMPDADTIIVIWFKLLTLAGKTNDSGLVYFNKSIPFTDEVLATIMNRKTTAIRLALDLFLKLEMIEIEGDLISILNWEKHQNIDGLNKIREQNRLRKQKQRSLKKLDVTGQSQQCHATDIDIELEEDKEKKRKNTKKENPEFDKFWRIYPRKINKTGAMKRFNILVNQGEPIEDILKACENYARQCAKDKTEQKFIKQGQTFLNADLAYKDYLPTDEQPEQQAFDKHGYKRKECVNPECGRVWYGGGDFCNVCGTDL